MTSVLEDMLLTEARNIDLEASRTLIMPMHLTLVFDLKA